jgi:hypothetical protein
MTKKISIVFIIIVTAIIIVGLVVLKFVEQNTPASEGILPTTPKTYNYPTPTAFQFIPTLEKSMLVSKLPLETDEYIIEYLPADDIFYVTVMPGNTEKNQEAAIRWLAEQEVPNPGNNQKVKFMYLFNRFGE